MRHVSLFEGLQQGGTKVEGTTNPHWSTFETFLAKPQYQLILQAPATPDQTIDNYVMASLLMLTNNLANRLLGGTDAQTFVNLVNRAVERYNSVANPPRTASDLLRARIAGVVANWPK